MFNPLIPCPHHSDLYLSKVAGARAQDLEGQTAPQLRDALLALNPVNKVGGGKNLYVQLYCIR